MLPRRTLPTVLYGCLLSVVVASVGQAVAAAVTPGSTSPAAVVIRDASVFDSAAGVMLPHRTLVRSGDEIQELEMLVESGLSPAAALQAATVHNAWILKQTEKLGRIERGFQADLVILKIDHLQERDVP